MGYRAGAESPKQPTGRGARDILKQQRSRLLGYQRASVRKIWRVYDRLMCHLWVAGEQAAHSRKELHGGICRAVPGPTSPGFSSQSLRDGIIRGANMIRD